MYTHLFKRPLALQAPGMADAGAWGSGHGREHRSKALPQRAPHAA